MNEIVDFLNKGSERGLLLKMDFEKAYDNVDWGFLQFVLRKIRFGIRWQKWIERCLKTTKVSVLVNEVIIEPFKMERRIG